MRFIGHFHGWHDHVAAGATSNYDGSSPPGVLQSITDLSILMPTDDVGPTVKLLESRDDIAAFAPEPITPDDIRRWQDALLARAHKTFDELARRRARLKKEHRGLVERVLELPDGVNTDKMNAEFVNGVLEITAPIAAIALPRKIEIKATTPYTKQVAA